MANEKNSQAAAKREASGNREIEINIMSLISLFFQNLLLIGCVMLLALVGTFIFSRIQTPEYSSTATLYILKNEENSTTAYNDFTLATNTINDCKWAITSTPVLDEVLDNLGMKDKYTVSRLSSSISSENPSNTRFLKITVTAASPSDARALANEICNVTAEKMESAQNLKQVNIYSYGKESSTPSNQVGLKMYIIAALAAAVLVYGVLVVIYIINDNIETDEEFTSKLGLTVLGTIPDVNSVTGKKYGIYGKIYAKYGAKYAAKKSANDIHNSGNDAK